LQADAQKTSFLRAYAFAKNIIMTSDTSAFQQLALQPMRRTHYMYNKLQASQFRLPIKDAKTAEAIRSGHKNPISMNLTDLQTGNITLPFSVAEIFFLLNKR